MEFFLFVKYFIPNINQIGNTKHWRILSGCPIRKQKLNLISLWYSFKTRNQIFANDTWIRCIEILNSLSLLTNETYTFYKRSLCFLFLQNALVTSIENSINRTINTDRFIKICYIYFVFCKVKLMVKCPIWMMNSMIDWISLWLQ